MKTGRKQLPYQSPTTGKTIDGLSRMKDGRWRVIGTQTRFSEPDEQKAIERFLKMVNPNADKAGGWIGHEHEERGGVHFHSLAALWEHVATEIRTRPLWVAEQTGIEQIGYLDDLQKPESLPTFKEIEQVWETFYTKTAKRRTLRAWEDFKTTTGVEGLKQITPEICISYRDNVYARKYSPKNQSNRFTRIRRLFTFCRQREIAPNALAKVIDSLKRLTPDETSVSLDPKPIDPAVWKKLLAKSTGEVKAMILLMLNGTYYCAEVVRLKWAEIKDGCIVTHRNKEGKCVRACVLWQETIDALAAIRKRGDFLFYAPTGKPLKTGGAELRFRTLRDNAEVPKTVTSSHLRDGAATAMAEAKVSERELAIVMGQRSGISDHYVKRNPRVVVDACLAVYQRYFS